MRPPSERTTPTLGVEISGFFPPVILKSYYSVLVGRHRQIAYKSTWISSGRLARRL
jgi:hypothetical protein